MKTLDKIAEVLVLVGALNWGLWGLFQFDLVAAIFGGSTAVLSRLIYSLVGLSAVYWIFSAASRKRRRVPVSREETPTFRRAA